MTEIINGIRKTITCVVTKLVDALTRCVFRKRAGQYYYNGPSVLSAAGGSVLGLGVQVVRYGTQLTLSAALTGCFAGVLVVLGVSAGLAAIVFAAGYFSRGRIGEPMTAEECVWFSEAALLAAGLVWPLLGYGPLVTVCATSVIALVVLRGLEALGLFREKAVFYNRQAA